MSRFEKNNQPVKLDANGNLDTSVLERELTAALEFDVRYKQQDNMKKKAVKTSGTYDDFKAMVACSHLKTLTSKEVESLSSKKQGWQRDYVPTNADAAHILMQEAKKNSIDEAKELAFDRANMSAFKAPKNLLALERDLCRSLKAQDKQIEYLKAMGLKKLKSLLKGEKDCTPELLEVLIRAVLAITTAPEPQPARTTEIQASKVSANEVDDAQREQTNAASTESTESTADEVRTESQQGAGSAEKEKKFDPYRWFRALSSYSRFHITKMFLPAPLLQSVLQYLEGHELPLETSEEERLDLQAVRERFRL